MAKVNDAPEIHRRVTSDYQNIKNTMPQVPIGISFEEASHMLAAIKHQALINIAYPRYDDRRVNMSETSIAVPARSIIAYQRSTHLYDDKGEVLFPYEIQDLVEEILRHRDVLRERRLTFNPAYGTDGPMVPYRNAVSKLLELVIESVRHRDKDRIDHLIHPLFAI